MLASTMPPVCDGDHMCSSIMAICHVASAVWDIAVLYAVLVLGDFSDSRSGQIKWLRVIRDDLSALNLSMLSIPVMADQPDISRALETRNCVILMAPYGSNRGIEGRSVSGERKRRTASVYCTGECPESRETSLRCAHSTDDDAVQYSSGQGRSCLISKWDIERGIHRTWYQSASI